MALSTCPRCKSLFDKIRSAVCPKCTPDEEADYEKVHTVLREQSEQLNCVELAEAAGVSEECVLRMIDDNVISSSMMNLEATCGRCGAPAISPSKRLCEKCLGELNLQMAAEKRKLNQPMQKDPQQREAGHGVHQSLDEKRRT